MPDEVFSVSELTSGIREHLEDRFHGIWVEGEVSNHRLPGSGHHYFTLKDSRAQLACVLFRGSAMKTRVAPSDGMQVQVFGDVSVYEARGQYQLIAQLVQPKGFGDLQAKFEALKRKLDGEGLFDPARKKPIPAFPTTLGIVTSPTGAAIRDILNVLARRAPWVRVVVQPVRVQGEGAATEIAAGIRNLDTATDLPRPDLILVARGGGSIEDLWSFNEEVVARAIAACSLPVMCGVGHEIDFTIADFVADRREPTPSAAAENAVPDGAGLKRHTAMLSASLSHHATARLATFRRAVDSLRRELQAREPGRKLQGWAQSLDYLGERRQAALERRLAELDNDAKSAGQRLLSIHPDQDLHRAREKVALLETTLEKLVERSTGERRRKVEALGDLMHSLSPESVLTRGYSLTTDAKGKLVTDAGDVAEGDRVETRLARGRFTSVVDGKESR
ncbi:MAG: exodeoxyribonuclease VII large subunit [Verrucomicrobiales bacterium]